MNHNKFIYLKKQILQENYITYMWYLIDKETRQGVHFHGVASDILNYYVYLDNQYRFRAYVIELHSKKKKIQRTNPY